MIDHQNYWKLISL